MADELALTAKYGSLISALARSLAPEDVTAFLSDLGALADSGLPNLSPLLKYILHLKGKPYTLQEHFPFEPVFNTTLPKSLTLKTGRQVSKCVSGEGSPLLYAPNGQPRKFEEIKVGDKVLSVNRLGLSNAGTVTGVFAQAPSDLIKIVTSTGCWCVVTRNHKLLTLDGYKEARHLCQQDKVAVIQRGGFFSFSALSANSAKLAFSNWMAFAEYRNNSELRLKEEAFVLSAPEVKALIESFLLTNAVSEDGVLKVTHDRFLIEDVRSLLWKLEIPSSLVQKHTQTSLAFDTKNSLSALKTVFPKLTTRFDLKEPDRELERSQDLLWDPIVEITSLPQAPSFDIEVEEDHNYVLNGLVSHNSTSLASQGIILAATFPFFNTLYVTPLYEMIRRFSNNYVRGFIEQSPIKRFLLQGTGQSNVMQRSFFNNSTMFFSFAFLDCERVRGLSVDRMVIDESVYHLTGVDIKKHNGVLRVPIKDVQPGDYLPAPTPDGTVELDKVVSVHNHGVRDCYELSFENGQSFAGTTDCAVGTEFGWKRISTIIEDVYTALSDNASKPTRLHPARIQHGEVPDIVRVFEPSTRDREESQLRKMSETLDNKELSGLARYLFIARPSNDNLSENCFEQDQKRVPVETTRLVGIRYIGKQPVLDIETEKHHSFFANGIAVHNCQNMDETFIPIIRETMSASRFALSMYAGTPLTLDNTLEKMWKTSSQGEWLIDCQACKYVNVPAFGYDLDDMIGPLHDDISIHCPAVICAKCKRPINPRSGRWVHKFPERRFDHAGYHVPQILLPMHYASYDKWATLCAKREGAFNTTPAQFYNEVLGESYDDGAKLLTESELIDACMLHENTIENAQKIVDKYTYRVLGIDWGGGGAKETSFTTYAVVGLCPDGSGLECFYGYRSLTPHDHKREARMALQIARELKCDAIAHDFNGAGAFREEYITTAGYPLERIAPISYVRATVQAAMRHVPATDINPRAHYRLDKTRSLVTICHEIKAKRLRLFAYDYKSQEQRGLVQDFMALVEEKTDTRTAGDTYVIIRQQNQSDDFAHAVNYASSLIWHITDLWPKAAHSDRYRVSDIVIKDLDAYAEDF